MSEHFSTLLREHVERAEPPFLLQPEPVVQRGRRRLRRRRIGVAAAVVVVGAAAALPAALTHDDTNTTGSMDPATAAALKDYDAQKMPAKLRAAADDALARSGASLGTGEFAALDDQQASLPSKYWDKASSMSVTYGGATDDRFTLLLLHSASEAEGNARKICANELATGDSFSCDVSTAANGDIVTTRVTALRPLKGMPGWGLVTTNELRTGRASATDARQDPIDADEVWFERSVESVHSDTFLTSTYEQVKAPDLATAEKRFTVSPSAMQDLVTDPSLVIPKPPIGANKCPWSLHQENISCDVPAPDMSSE